MPRGSSLGMVMQIPGGDQTSQSYKEMLAYMDVCMGGRVAEEIIFGEENVTSGASSDIRQATRLARAMVTRYGFSEKVGVVFHYLDENGTAAETRACIDAEVERITDSSYQRAKELLTKHKKEHKLLAECLLEFEMLTGEEDEILSCTSVNPFEHPSHKQRRQRQRPTRRTIPATRPRRL